MDKLAYTGVINHDENVEYPLNFSSDGIYEVVCKLNGGCEIKIKSSNYIDAHEIHKDYYKFHINVISRRKYILSIQGIFRHQCRYNIKLKKACIDKMYISKYQWYIKNYITGIDINILPVIVLCNKVDTRLGIIDSFIDVNNDFFFSRKHYFTESVTHYFDCSTAYFTDTFNICNRIYSL